MASGSPHTELLEIVVRALEESDVPYMLTGSFASTIHGISRSTFDIDFVIAPDAVSLRRLVQEFQTKRYYVSPEAADGAFARAGMFNVIDHETGLKVDFIIVKPRDFSQTEFERRQPRDAFGVRMFVASPEDVLVAKLEWSKIGGSTRQLEDAAGIIRRQGKNLDLAYIERWVRELGLEEQWKAANSAAGG